MKRKKNIFLSPWKTAKFRANFFFSRSKFLIFFLHFEGLFGLAGDFERNLHALERLHQHGQTRRFGQFPLRRRLRQDRRLDHATANRELQNGFERLGRATATLPIGLASPSGGRCGCLGSNDDKRHNGVNVIADDVIADFGSFTTADGGENLNNGRRSL